MNEKKFQLVEQYSTVNRNIYNQPNVLELYCTVISQEYVA